MLVLVIKQSFLYIYRVCNYLIISDVHWPYSASHADVGNKQMAGDLAIIWIRCVTVKRHIETFYSYHGLTLLVVSYVHGQRVIR